MDDESARRELDQDSDYDGVWKEALREHLAEFVEKYFPAEHAAIDWSHEPQWYDKELSQVLGQPGQRNRTVDLLARVRLRTGQEQWILLHLEIQTSYEPDFAVRISRYNAGLNWVFKRRVLTLVVLADLRRGWCPEEDLFQVGTFESRLKFPVCKLIDRLSVEWHADHTLPVLLGAQIEALRTAGDPAGRYRAKWLLVRGLYDLGYNAQQVREIFRLIDWMMHLRIDLETQFEQDLAEFEQETAMPYVTSVERIAEARGEARGKTSLVLSLLSEVCGRVPKEHEDRVRKLTSEQLEQLAKALLRFQSLADVQSWLNQHAGSEA